MKTSKFQRRFYRDWTWAKDLHESRIIAKETDLQILTNKRLDKEFVEQRIRAYRWDIENYISRDFRFPVALKPLSVELSAPAIIREMADQSRKANVGPMACVAGAISEFLGRDLLKKGYKEVIVENGGDIFLASKRIRRVGLYAGRSKLWNNLRLVVKPKDMPLGICTSSGTIGHSLSFGCADSVVVLSRNTALADAVATACANQVNVKSDMQKALDFTRSINGITGIVIILKNHLLSWGKIEFVD